jgi:hypothetical protein
MSLLAREQETGAAVYYAHIPLNSMIKLVEESPLLYEYNLPVSNENRKEYLLHGIS